MVRPFLFHEPFGKFLEFDSRGFSVRLDFIEKWGALGEKGELRAQRRFFERFARERVERLSMEHAMSFDYFVCFAQKQLNLVRYRFNFSNLFELMKESISVQVSQSCAFYEFFSSKKIIYFRFSNKYSLNLWLTVVLCLRFLVFMKYSGPQVSRKITFKVGANHSEFWLFLKVGANHSDKMWF